MSARIRAADPQHPSSRVGRGLTLFDFGRREGGLVRHCAARLDASRAEFGGTASAGTRIAQFGAEARGRTTQRRPPAHSHLSHASIPPWEALAAARADEKMMRSRGKFD